MNYLILSFEMGSETNMPDWSYRTLFRPILFRLPAHLARGLTLKSFGLLGKLPGGSFVIRTMGHMEKSPLLESQIGKVKIKYPVGLSGGVDIHGSAQAALSQIGFGFLRDSI
jgi:dihydroorotate dehydrogenase